MVRFLLYLTCKSNLDQMDEIAWLYKKKSNFVKSLVQFGQFGQILGRHHGVNVDLKLDLAKK